MAGGGGGGVRGRGRGRGRGVTVRNEPIEGSEHELGRGRGVHVMSDSIEGSEREHESGDGSGTGSEDNSNADVSGNHSAVGNVLSIEPGKLWFDDGKVVRKVTRSIKAHYHHPYLNWRETPHSVKDQWFNNFRGFCTWNPTHENAVKRHFDETARLRLKDNLYDAGSKVKGKDKPCPSWMTPEVYKAFLERRKDKAFRKRSKQASLNKKCAEEGPTHHYGSIKAIKHAAKMERYEKLQEDYRSKGEEVTAEQAWFDAVGGFKKGHVYGLGSAAPLYYQTPPTSKGKSSNTPSSYTPGILSQVEARAMEAYQKEVEEHRKFREETRLREETYLKNQEEMMKQLTSLSQLIQTQTCNPNQFNNFHNPNDDNSGGGGIRGCGVGFQV
ncbi:hypothetical protein RND81_02G158200 [Saponaria officinalis]|uniref:Transposase, Ptta/En/Spm, plant n=1 Tax=Saponaria officinalis TaxID=3572 RepID=A0AAW1MQH7_SAPOF